MAAHLTLFKLITLAFSCFHYSTLVKAQANYSLAYANDFVDPNWFLKKEFGAHTSKAQVSVLTWAKDLAAKGPWSVMDKPFVAPSGTKHDFMSWAPYSWPNCADVGNTTALSDEEVWRTCPYYNRDGLFNPDARVVNDVGRFGEMSEAVFYNALSWVITNETAAGKATYEENAAKFLKIWFLDEATRMNPNLNYAQMQRGPDGQTGSNTGVLDLKNFSKLASAILILRKGQSKAWTKTLDDQFVAWSKEYLHWLQTDRLALAEKAMTNNHGSFYFNQAAAIQIIIGDNAGATTVLNEYFNGIYKGQINSTGEQPLEAARSRSYHYRAYNLAAMITNARLLEYVAPTSKPWQIATNGATIKSALDYAMKFKASETKEDRYEIELHPNVAALAAEYGDADGRYLEYLTAFENGSFIEQPYVLWNQPFAVGVKAGFTTATSGKSNSSSDKATGTKTGENGASQSAAASTLFYFASVVAAGLLLL